MNAVYACIGYTAGVLTMVIVFFTMNKQSKLPRFIHKWWANRRGYFWIPCPICGRGFGGHEHNPVSLDSNEFTSTNCRIGYGICRDPSCTKEAERRNKLLANNQSYIVRLQAELAVLKDELTCEECEKSLEDTETGVTAFCMLCWNAMVTKLRAENKARDEEIKRLNAFKRFYHHIERHIRPDDELICNICGMSLNDIEQALNREKQGEKNGPEEAGVVASERDNNQ